MSLGQKVGVVTHYYDQIGVAVLELSASLKTGDKVKFVKDEEELFEQTVESMQIDHENIDDAKKGCELGIKVDEPVSDDTEVYKAD